MPVLHYRTCRGREQQTNLTEAVELIATRICRKRIAAAATGAASNNNNTSNNNDKDWQIVIVAAVGENRDSEGEWELLVLALQVWERKRK